MADLGQIDVRIGADTKRLEQGLQKSKGELKEFEGKVSTGAAKMALFTGAAIAGAAALRGLGQFIASSVRLSADLAETQSKFNTVFDSSSAKVDKLASSFGILSKGEAQGFLATTGAILRGAGLAGEEVDNLASQVGELARDFSSFNNVPVAETFNAINAAITGEREQLKRFGIVLNEADVQQRALADSGKRVAKELTQQEKAVATLALITEKATVQVGDHARTSGSAANQAKSLESNINNLGEAFAEGLTPAVTGAFTALNDISSSDSLQNYFVDLGTTVGDFASGFLLTLNDLASGWADFIKFVGLGSSQLSRAQQQARELVPSATERALPFGIGQIFQSFQEVGARNRFESENIPFSQNQEGVNLEGLELDAFKPITPVNRFEGGGGGAGGNADPTRKLTLANTLELIDAENRYQAGLGVSQSNAAALTKELVDTVTNQEIAAGLAELTGENMANISEAVNDIDLNPFLEQIGKAQVKLTDTQKLLTGAFTTAIAESLVIMADATASVGEKMAAIGNLIKSILVDLGKTLVIAELASVIGGGKLNPVKLISGIGAIIAAGQIKTSTPDVNKSFGKATTQGSQLVASVGVDQIHFAIERYKSENFLA